MVASKEMGPPVLVDSCLVLVFTRESSEGNARISTFNSMTNLKEVYDAQSKQKVYQAEE